jgi:hypothetical protein
MTAWLRKQAQADLAAAKIISNGGFQPQHWDTSPPGQVNPPHDPGSEDVSAAIGRDPAYSSGWVKVWAWDQVIGEEEDEEPSTVAVVAEIGRRQFDHVIRHDPRTEAARAESVLAVLGEHYILTKDDRSEAYEEFSVVAIGGANKDRGCVTCHYYGMGGVKGYGVCRTVRLLTSGYRHREGFKEEWLP